MTSLGWWWLCCLTQAQGKRDVGLSENWGWWCPQDDGDDAVWPVQLRRDIGQHEYLGDILGDGDDAVWLAGRPSWGRGWLYLHPHAPGMGGPQLIVSPKLWRGSLIMSMISIMFMKMRMIDNDTALCVKQWKLRRSKVPKSKYFSMEKRDRPWHFLAKTWRAGQRNLKLES